jgi:LuxR family maltose regulon positive regulatory protein
VLDTLLSTKLYAPRTGTNLVSRPRLHSYLDEGLTRKLTLVSAPAGFGKSTLVADWIATLDRPAVWISLDAGDNDPARFLAYLIAALQQIEAAIGQATQSLLRAPERPDIEALLTLLVNDIATVPGAFVLVLDDCHLITDAGVLRALAFFIGHQPPLLTPRAGDARSPRAAAGAAAGA